MPKAEASLGRPQLAIDTTVAANRYRLKETNLRSEYMQSPLAVSVTSVDHASSGRTSEPHPKNLSSPLYLNLGTPAVGHGTTESPISSLFSPLKRFKKLFGRRPESMSCTPSGPRTDDSDRAACRNSSLFDDLEIPTILLSDFDEERPSARTLGGNYGYRGFRDV
jgi:hypothetical protein